MAHLPFLQPPQTAANALPPNQASVVDLRPWQIAQALSPLAVSREEAEFAHEAERLADHEVNQAFAIALRQAATPHGLPTAEARALAQKVAQLQQMARDDQAHVRSLTAAGDGANHANDDELKLAQAQLDLDTDELNDAEHDLARASGDVRARIQQELSAHQALVTKMSSGAGADGQVAILSARQYGTLAGRIGAWMSQRSRYQLLQQALLQARTGAAALTAQHNALESVADANSPAAEGLHAETGSAARLAQLQRKREQRQLLSLLDDRIQTQGQLEDVYRGWAAQVLLQHTIVLHLAMRSLAWIVCLLMTVIACEAAGAALLERQALDHRRLQTLRTILRLGMQVCGGLCVLLITFGVPSQLSTILGLATAGLTVALQSLILAFFGWFILMGRNGMRVGDWVEINGVAGEVVEITLFRTTLLETREWAAKGHPTGRRATFMNNFAVAGQFFNFSTAGQWMWDEMSISLAASPEAYEQVAQISDAVLAETQENAAMAEAEWQRVPRQSTLRQTSAAASVHMRPAGAGVDLLIRYVTRAAERLEVRNRLYERVLDLLHKPQVVIHTPQPSKLTAAVLAAGDPDQGRQNGRKSDRANDRQNDPGDKRASMYT